MPSVFLYFYVESATCATVSCKSGQKCLVEKKTGRPRCVTCNLLCSEAETSGKRKDTSGKVCGSNDKTYHSWCQMFMDACATGVVIETKASGPCRGDIPSAVASINHRRSEMVRCIQRQLELRERFQRTHRWNLNKTDRLSET
ncbi:follistatin-A [Aphis craccivora]|uniref:Follistatin-A n=1 Tax=Aphis craccivora TaxID=307492 RepID=A0A6G0Z2L6_APHCR|nr:follistatin-A [Aphis craccivora]